MASKKDLVEAHQFSRRRLVSAFLSGAPGGREVEPPRPGRTVAGGVVLAVLLVAGGAVAHFLHPAAATDWDTQNGLVVTKGGARYVVVGPDNKKQLRPVVNLTSAQLLLGLDLEQSSKVIDQNAIAQKRPGPTIGISGPDVPDQLPTKKQFINSGWTACTSDNEGTFLDISAKPDVKAAPTSGLLVKTPKSTYLIADGQAQDGTTRAYAYDLEGRADSVGVQLFNGAAPGVLNVPQSWVDLFDAGTPIDFASFGLKNAGQPYTGKNAGGTFNVGSYANFNQLHYLLTDKGWEVLDDFSYNLYPLLASAEGQPAADVTSAINSAPVAPPQPRTVNWPKAKPDAASGTACAELVTKGASKPYVMLAGSPGAHAWPSSKPLAPDVPTALVDPGMGAFVYAGTGPNATSGDPFLIDSSAHANKLDGDATVAKLKLTTKDGPVIPGSWLLLVPGGAALSTEMALCPPATQKVEDAQCVASGE